MNNNAKMTVKKWVGAILKSLLVAVVLFFTATESINFFKFVFPQDQWYMAYTGFGLTLGALFVYLYMLLYDARTSLQKTVSLIMISVGVIGELLTAGFGMEIQGSAMNGMQLTASDMSMMIWVVRIMIFVHAAAFLFYSFGDKIIAAFNDDDGDGIPNYRDKVDNRKQPAQRPQEAPGRAQLAPSMSETKAEELADSPLEGRERK